MISADARPRPTTQTEGRDLGDEMLFYDRNGDQIHILNGTAREIYLLCDGSRSIDDVAASMVVKYEIPAADARQDVEETVDRLIGLGLLISG